MAFLPDLPPAWRRAVPTGTAKARETVDCLVGLVWGAGSRRGRCGRACRTGRGPPGMGLAGQRNNSSHGPRQGQSRTGPAGPGPFDVVVTPYLSVEQRPSFSHRPTTY